MTKKTAVISILMVLMAATALFAGCTGADNTAAGSGDDSGTVEMITITDSLGREITVPKNPDAVVCSGSGTLRYLTYLQAEDKIVGVDDIELRDVSENRRPYALANPQFMTDYPIIGEYRGLDDPEKIVAAGPDVIFKSYLTSSADADELQEKTGIPVVALNYGDLTDAEKDDMYFSLRLMGKVMGKEDRAEDVIAFFDSSIADLEARTADIPEDEIKTAYIGGVSYRGGHGFQSTNPTYPPFTYTNVKNVAGELGGTQADVSKESILDWEPEYIFVDLGTWQITPNAIDELKTDESFMIMSAVKSGEVYGVLPYNSYTTNHGSVIADAYYVGSVVYPDSFSDIDPEKKADEIFEFLVDEPVYDQLNVNLGNFGFTKIDVTPI